MAWKFNKQQKEELAATAFVLAVGFIGMVTYGSFNNKGSVQAPAALPDEGASRRAPALQFTPR